jgi:hypothetical protein
MTDQIIGGGNPAIIAAGLTAPLVGGSGGGMMGGMSGGGEGSRDEGGMPGMAGGPGMRGGMPGMSGAGGAMPGGMGSGSGAEGPDIRDAQTTINRTIFFDPSERKAVLAIDDVVTEYDIMGGAAGGGLGGDSGMMGGAMPGGVGMPGGAGMPGMGGAGGTGEQWTHVVYRVNIVTWLDTDPVKPTVKFNTRREEHPNAHDYDSVHEPNKDRTLSPSDPKNPRRLGTSR